jgi:hypothetical protein
LGATTSAGFSSKIGFASPLSGSARLSRVAHANTFDTVVSHTFAMCGFERRAFMLAWIAALSMSSMSTVPFSAASASSMDTRGRRVAGRSA